MRGQVYVIAALPQIFDFWAVLPYMELMKRSAYIISAAFLSLAVGFTAAACEFHSGYGSPFQSRWDNYTQQETFGDKKSLPGDSSYTPTAKPKKKKPVFSKAASRASDIAKARVERKTKAERAADETPVVEQASR